MEKQRVEQQSGEILNAFKTRKIKKELRNIEYDRLLIPVTIRLDKKKQPFPDSVMEDESQPSPDYSMDEFDRTNPFGAKLQPDWTELDESENRRNK